MANHTKLILQEHLKQDFLVFLSEEGTNFSNWLQYERFGTCWIWLWEGTNSFQICAVKALLLQEHVEHVHRQTQSWVFELGADRTGQWTLPQCRALSCQRVFPISLYRGNKWVFPTLLSLLHMMAPRQCYSPYQLFPKRLRTLLSAVCCFPLGSSQRSWTLQGLLVPARDYQILLGLFFLWVQSGSGQNNKTN